MEFNSSFPQEPALEHVIVSVIIPSLNEEQAIAQCLSSLTRLDYARESFEVILVDNGSTDKTIEIARSYSNLLNLTVLQKAGVRVSAVRNLGAARACGKIFAFLDADCVVSPAWLTQASAMLKQKDVGVVGAHFRIPNDSGWVARAWYGNLEIEKQGDLAWVPGCNTVVRRSTFESVGGFDESIETNEDCEFCDRVRAVGFRVIGDASIAVVHLGIPHTLAEFYRKIRWHSTDGLRVFLRGLPKISNARPLLFGLYTLICLAGIGVGIIVAVLQKKFDLLAAFVVALLLPSFLLSLRLASRRKQWTHLVPLILLHFVYGMARGQSFLDLKNWGGSRKRPEVRLPGTYVA